jgi:hypothetical protein
MERKLVGLRFWLFSGGGLPQQQWAFFSVRKMYLIPMFLATSTNWGLYQCTFCQQAEAVSGLPPVIYIIQVHPQFCCVHVNYVQSSHCGNEREFLFVPYSAF